MCPVRSVTYVSGRSISKLLPASLEGNLVFVDPARFDFVAALEAHWEAIRSEYLALPYQAFDPWVQRQMHGGGWTVFGLYAIGQPIPAACAVCPQTARALQLVPRLSMAGFSHHVPTSSRTSAGRPAFTGSTWLSWFRRAAACGLPPRRGLGRRGGT
jgi:aspartyl/asparaginyl beta-hydroxylase (cupin superfamily)